MTDSLTGSRIESTRPLSPRQCLLIICIPVLALLVASRQIYLSSHHDLSTWKGGGMGMFAGADGTLNRYVKIFLVDQYGSRQPVAKLTSDQTDLLTRALNFPVRENFLLVAKLMARLDWIASPELWPVARIDSNGENAGRAPESYHAMMPFGERPRDATWKGDIQIEYWTLSYDPQTRRARAILAHTFVFKPDELRR